MPIYEFTCPKCGATFDELLPSSRSQEPANCPKCGSKNAKRNFTSFGTGGGSGGSGSQDSGGGCAPRGRVG